MKVYRIARAQYIHDLSGTGAKIHGGRWNPKGTPQLYCAENISLAILEILVHFDALTIPSQLKLLTLEIPSDEIMEFSRRKFQKIRKLPDSEYVFKNEGDSWIKSNKSLALKVPSIITELEYNVLINPLHKNFNRIKNGRAVDMKLDERLIK